MSPLIQSLYPWDSKKKVLIKKNPGLGNIFTLIVVFTYFLLFIFTVAGKLYPVLRDTDVTFLGQKSGLVSALGYLVYNWGVSVVLFLVALLLTTILSAAIAKTGIKSFKTYLEFVRIDTKKLQRREIVKIIFKDTSKIAGYSIIIFIVLELLTLAACSLIITFILPLIYNINEKSLAFVFLALLVAHIIFFPLFTILYNRMVNKKLDFTETTNLDDFMTEEGEIDMEKWRARTWGKKSYTFDWEEEDVFPITCFSCGSIISSDLTICPICDADLIKEIEEIDAEYKSEDDETEKEVSVSKVESSESQDELDDDVEE